MLSDGELKLIGGSDAAAIAGVSIYRGPIDIYRRIVENHRWEGNERTRLGELMEPVIRELYREHTGYKLLGPQKLQRGFWRFNLDDVAELGASNRVIDFKNVHFRSAHQYENEGDIPPDAACQMQVYMEAIDAETADLAALVDGELKIVTIHRDRDTWGLLNEAANRFWAENILKKTPPEIDGSKSSADWLKSRFKTHKEPPVQSIPFIDTAAANFERYEAEMEAAKEKMKLAKNIITEFIGTAKGVTGLGWRATISDVKGKLATNWEAIAAEVGIPEEIIQKHTTIGAGHPRFNFSRTK